jgi:hypothetical protein
MIKFKFISKNQEDIDININNMNNIYSNDEEEEKEMKEEEFKEIFVEYKKKSKKICEKIREILTEKKVRNISDKKYQELFDYIEQNQKPKKEIMKNPNNLFDPEN